MGLHSTHSVATSGAAPTLVVSKTVVSKPPYIFPFAAFVDKYSSICDPVNLQRFKPSHLCQSWHVCVESVTAD